MAFDPDCIEALPIEQFRRFAIACCYRLGCDRKDKRLAKALKQLEQSLGPPLRERPRRDAFNAANSAHADLSAHSRVMGAIVSAVTCACSEAPIPNLIGNFEYALEEGEHLSRDEVREIERELLQSILDR